MSVEVRPFEQGAAMEITGLDLSRPLPDDAFKLWREAFLACGVIVIRGQHFSDQQHIDFSERFGPLEEFPDTKDQALGFAKILRVTNIDRDSGGLRSFKNDVGFQSFILGTGSWHIDSSYRKNPGKASLLYALEVPATGGGTKFANTNFAYEAMPDDRKQRLAGITVVHDFNATRDRFGLPKRPKEVSDKTPPVRHSLVTQLPDGKKVLMIGMHADYIEGMERGESEALLDALRDWCTQPRFVHHHRWRVGDLVMWDNMSILHRAMPYDMENDRRRLHRTTVAGHSTVI